MRDRKVSRAALLLLAGYPLPVDLMVYLLEIGIDLRAFERRYSA